MADGPVNFQMSEADLRKFAELAQDFYLMKQADSGMVTPIRKAWATNDKEGLLIIVSAWGTHSANLAAQLGIPWTDGNG